MISSKHLRLQGLYVKRYLVESFIVAAYAMKILRCTGHLKTSELTYYSVYETGYPDSVVFYFLFLKFMLVELILAACTEYVIVMFGC